MFIDSLVVMLPVFNVWLYSSGPVPPIARKQKEQKVKLCTPRHEVEKMKDDDMDAAVKYVKYLKKRVGVDAFQEGKLVGCEITCDARMIAV